MFHVEQILSNHQISALCSTWNVDAKMDVFHGSPVNGSSWCGSFAGWYLVQQQLVTADWLSMHESLPQFMSSSAQGRAIEFERHHL